MSHCLRDISEAEVLMQEILDTPTPPGKFPAFQKEEAKVVARKLKQLGYSQRDIAAYLGCSQTTVSRMLQR